MAGDRGLTHRSVAQQGGVGAVASPQGAPRQDCRGDLLVTHVRTGGSSVLTQVPFLAAGHRAWAQPAGHGSLTLSEQMGTWEGFLHPSL